MRKNTVEIRVPDIGDFDQVAVVEVLVSPGDGVEVEQGIITLESDKASMEIPATHAGTVKEVKVLVGDEIGEGAVIAVLEVEEGAETEDDPKSRKSEKKEASPKDIAPPPPEPEGKRSVAAAATANLSAEIVVLGSGPGGYTAAFRAADLGKEVLLIERYPDLGGVCLNVGCIPSKALLHAAKVIDDAAAFAEHGIDFGKPKIDLGDLRGFKNSTVKKLTGGLAGMAKKRDVKILQGTGRFSGPNTLAVETNDGVKTVAFESAIIAAGSRVMKLPDLPYGDARLMDSTSALELEEIPKKLLVIGGGIIGLEMATVYHALGSKITVVELLDGLIPGCDRDIVKPFHKWIEARYEAIYLESKVTKIEAQKKGLKVFFEGEDVPESEHFDRVLVAVGRRPNGHEIGADAAGVKVDERGFIPTDRQMRTNVSHIFAIGDIVGQPMLAHKATHEGKVAAEVIAGQKASFDARVIPSVAYTDPEIAWIGVTEDEAKEKGIPYEKASFPWSASGRSLGLGRSEGRTKLLFDPETHRVIGGAMVGPHAGDLVAEVALAIEMGCEAEDIGLTIHAHPTLSETVAFSAEAFAGTLTDLYLPKKKKR